jgi:phospholipid/cholesterol/gamma-HCH transport system substrate-binding protein
MKFFTKEVRIALVAIVGLVLLFFGMNFLKGVNLFSSDNTYYVSFDNISGLSGSSPIMANGFKVGTVKSIHYDYNKMDEIIAVVGIDKDLKLPKGTEAEISSDLLGNVQLDLVLGPETGEYLKENDSFKGRVNSGALGQLKEMVPNIKVMIPKIDSILMSVNHLLADPALGETLHNAEFVTRRLTTTTGEINQLLIGLNKSVPGMLKKTDGVLSQANATMTNTTEMTEKLKQLDIETTLNELTSTLNNLKQLTTKLNDDKGTLAKMLNDDSMYNNLNATLAHADSLLVNLREHPKRYVHFSVFGKKDK